jgi:hypothetical protein
MHFYFLFHSKVIFTVMSISNDLKGLFEIGVSINAILKITFLKLLLFKIAKAFDKTRNFFF